MRKQFAQKLFAYVKLLKLNLHCYE